MSDTCPTVKVKNDAAPGGFMFINETDFVEGTHELFDAPAEDAAPKRTKAKAAEPAAE